MAPHFFHLSTSCIISFGIYFQFIYTWIWYVSSQNISFCIQLISRTGHTYFSKNDSSSWYRKGHIRKIYSFDIGVYTVLKQQNKTCFCFLSVLFRCLLNVLYTQLDIGSKLIIISLLDLISNILLINQ
jgi:hypothetical protein